MSIMTFHLVSLSHLAAPLLPRLPPSEHVLVVGDELPLVLVTALLAVAGGDGRPRGRARSPSQHLGRRRPTTKEAEEALLAEAAPLSFLLFGAHSRMHTHRFHPAPAVILLRPARPPVRLSTSPPPPSQLPLQPATVNPLFPSPNSSPSLSHSWRIFRATSGERTKYDELAEGEKSSLVRLPRPIRDGRAREGGRQRGILPK